jgi:perosamine synthetase
MPVELWDYHWIDIVRGLMAVAGSSDSVDSLLLPGLGPCISTRSARTAILAALQALRLEPGARIGVPLYCCPVVFKAIRSAGFTTCFIDCGSRTACVSPEDLAKKSSRIEALIAVHLFGNPCEMTRLREVMNGKPIIEDCAQSLGSRFEDGRPSGSAGAIAAFSFRFGKYLSAGEGGALYSPQAEIQDRLQQIVATTPSPSRAKEVAHIAVNFLRAKLRSKPLWGIAGYRIWGYYNQNVEFSSKSPIVLSRSFRSDLDLIRRRLNGLDAEVKRQRNIAAYYRDSLQVDASMLRPESPGTYSNRYIFPIIFPSSASRDRMAAYLFNRRIGTAKPYSDVVEGAAKNYGYDGDCPATERLLSRTLVIPAHYRLKKRELDYVVRCFNEGWAKFKRRV